MTGKGRLKSTRSRPVRRKWAELAGSPSERKFFMIISALPRLRAIADFANQIWQPMVNAAKFPLRSSNYQPVPLASEAHLVARCHWSQRIGDGCVIDADRPFGQDRKSTRLNSSH